MLSDSLGSRASMLLEVENGLHNIAEISRYSFYSELDLGFSLICHNSVQSFVL